MVNRHSLRKRDGDLCHYCKRKTNFETTNQPDSATVEHLISAYESGTRRVGGRENCVIACNKCNNTRNTEICRSMAKVERAVFQYRRMKSVIFKPKFHEDQESAQRIFKNLRNIEAKYSLFIPHAEKITLL